MVLNILKKKGEIKEEDLKDIKFPLRGPGGKFIGKEKFLNLPREKQEKLLEEKPTVKQVRGAGGKFVSKERKKDSKKKSKKKEKKGKSKTKKGVKGPFSTQFYGKEIRRFYHQGSWYVSVKDLVSTATEPGVLEYYEEKKEKEKKISNLVQVIKIENGEVGELEIIAAKDIAEFIRTLKKPFPGALSRWAEGMSDLKLDEVEKQEELKGKDKEIINHGPIHPSDGAP